MSQTQNRTARIRARCRRGAGPSSPARSQRCWTDRSSAPLVPSYYRATVGGVDAVVVGSGPNGLAGALTLARAGHRVVVYEGAAALGGGCRTAELTLPGFRHDVCSAVHPLVLASPFFRSVDLAARGVKMLDPAGSFCPPAGRRPGGRRSVARSRTRPRSLGPDAKAYRRLFDPLVPGISKVHPDHPGTAPARARPTRWRRPAWRLPGLLPASWVARLFKTDEARALLAGAAAHSLLPLDQPLTGSYALLFVALGHTYGWPVVEGGSARLVDALVDELDLAWGARLHVGRWVKSLDELAAGPAVVLMDISTRQLADLVGVRATPVLPPRPRALPLRRRACARSTGR